MTTSELAAAVIAEARARRALLVTAESCTGGRIADELTNVAGASDVFWAGLVTYAETAKATALGVSPGLIKARGVVSREVALAMAEGARKNGESATGASNILAVSTTGVAGPAGGTSQEPVGTCYIALSFNRRPARTLRISIAPNDSDAASRASLKARFTREALTLLLQELRAIERPRE